MRENEIVIYAQLYNSSVLDNAFSQTQMLQYESRKRIQKD